MTEKQLNQETGSEVNKEREAVQAAEETKQPEVVQETAAKEKTAEELALEQGYYACCFRSH